MKYSKGFIPTLKEDPREAEITSHSLTLRAGLIRKIASGIYAFLPAGTRVLQKIEQIIREEMNRAGAVEIFLPVMQPADLWKKSGRWDEYGPELFRLKDRSDRDFCLGPTHEELITQLAYHDIRSYKDLPLNLYQIQVKFRDEIRPRYGLLRAREFIMKDAYSFCGDEKGLDEIYKKMHTAYSRIVERMDLKFRAVEADTGLIGGKSSHEFLVFASDGEETLVYCPDCDYAANMEMAGFRAPEDLKDGTPGIEEAREVSTPGINNIEGLVDFLNTGKENILKTMLLSDEEDNVYSFLIRGDRQLNLSKAEKFLGRTLDFYKGSEGDHRFTIGYIGPVSLRNIKGIYGDNSIKNMKDFITGANKADTHLKNVNMERDFKVDDFGDFSYPLDTDRCIKCGGKLRIEKGIEIGHIFKLGKKYSEKMGAGFIDRDGKQKPFIMGCYGIGVTRIMSAVIEQLHDEKGIIWPPSIAPYLVNLIVTTSRDSAMADAAEHLYNILTEAGVEVLYDDRNINTGIKFKDSDLLGIPLKLVIGKKYLESKMVEIQFRKNDEKTELVPENILSFIKDFKSKNIKK
ncbi:MAG: proline--tRNA ligase [Actinomycetia bacterium]|nr:proline--tRNA ligase [Actinomycetes bacterium]